MIQDLTEILRTNWKSWFASAAPEHFYFMKIIGDAPHEEDVTFLVFADNDRFPQVIARLSRSGPRITALRQEYDHLTQQSSHDGISPQAMRALWFGPSANGWNIYITSAPPGSPISSAKGRLIASSWPSSHD
jgi:hypothetical protein